MKKKFISLLMCLLLLLTGCGKKDNNGTNEGVTEGAAGSTAAQGNTEAAGSTAAQGNAEALGGDNKTFGETLDELGAYAGYFEGESSEISVECISGTKNAYKLEGTTLTFTEIAEDSIYSISGKFRGNIVIDVGDAQKFELELHGLALVCSTVNPITVISGDEVSIVAKKDYNNYIYDMREAVDSTAETVYSGAIHSESDLEIGGKGVLNVISENNNGIHTKNDLQVKNLTLLVACVDNALKGNDSVEIESGELVLIASGGDGIKTSDSDISEKGNQRGTVSLLGGTCTVYAACDGIDAAYDVTVAGDGTVLNIYTDKYSNYSSEVTANSSNEYYVRFESDQYKYSVQYYNNKNDIVWVDATYHSSVQGSGRTYYYYSLPKMTDYNKMRLFVYSLETAQSQDEEYALATSYLTPNTSYDTIALTSRGSSVSYSWTNYTTNIQEESFGGMGRPGGMGGFGGMNDGNTDKGDYSTKGIKAANEINVSGGTVSIKSYDDAIHANNDTVLENGASPLGNVNITGGNITVYSNDDGVHADGTLSITEGNLSITNSYEGIEGSYVNISGGSVSVISKDDGINGTATSGTAIAVSGGMLYIYCQGDGVDSNSRTSYSGIEFSGGNTVVISNSSGNSAIDTEQGYSYIGGCVIAVMPSGGMSSEATHCQNFSSIGKSVQLSLSEGSFLLVEANGSNVAVRMPVSMSAYVIILGDSSPEAKSSSAYSGSLDANGVSWN